MLVIQAKGDSDPKKRIRVREKERQLPNPKGTSKAKVKNDKRMPSLRESACSMVANLDLVLVQASTCMGVLRDVRVDFRSVLGMAAESIWHDRLLHEA